jgi:hypothetical protein
MFEKNTSEVEVSHINVHGFWLCVQDKEYFLPYREYPWFKEAKVKEILNVQLLHGYHLCWPQLEVDLELDGPGNAQSYPLMYK